MKTTITMAALGLILGLSGCASQPSPEANALGNAATAYGQATVANGAAQVAKAAVNAVPLTGQNIALVSTLVQQLGITPTQAMGGAGTIFSAAKRSLKPAQFGQLSQAVPGMSQILAATPILKAATGSNGSLMGIAGSALGNATGLGNIAAMASSFQSLGLGAGMVNRFIPVVLQYVQTQGGPGTMGLLQNALTN